ncbi:dynamin family protein [Sphaerospermopsis aphanizomenoides BCCUSP55]|uniref:dynamin family protein n=1 Tax=Sphaerospermopsis aphanizomenoides TaxID=459663 RepID=UPI001908E3B8|nr:dynamin family protein [Sphaerospermopsis aphanizomenoides]MBK1987636.1 dynamin family protein [Sphaerospermopsis aphanizomenoides BCCUSP55]
MTATYEQTINLDSVIEYKKVERTLIDDLTKLRGYSEKLKLNKSVELIDEVLNRIAERTFSVAIVGEFKRGKSTFINALLGKEILPSDILPCSATLNRVTYGVTPSVKIIFKNGREEQIPIDNLTNYVTKLTPESELKAESIKEAVVSYPIPYCQNSIEVIDTPGLNDDQNMTEVTLSVLPQVDAAIMIILAQAPFSEFERDLLENKLLTNDLGRVIFVVNVWDNYTPEQAERVLQNVKARIEKYVLIRAEEQFGKDSEEYKIYKQKIGEPKVFGLYVKQALDAKQRGDDELLTKSGFKKFESALEKFLTQERGIIVLQVPVNRVIASAQEIISSISIQEKAIQMNQQEFQLAYDRSVAEIATVRERQTKELRLIDGAAANVKMLLRPLVYNLRNELKKAAQEAIQSTSIEPKEVNNKKALAKKLGEQVSKTLQRTSDKLSQQIQDEVQRGIDQEVERLKDFAQSVDQALTNIQMEFEGIEGRSTRPTSGAAEAITAALSVFTGFGGIWSGYRVAGLKGALVGAGASLGTFFLAGLITGAIGLTAATFWPVVIATSVISIFTGGKLAEVVFSRDRVENFRKDYTEKILQEIEKKVQEEHLEQKIDEQITNPFEVLKRTLRQEVETFLDNTQKTLNDLNDKRGRNEAITDAQRQELNQIRTETEKILGNAQRLADQLVEIMSV